MHHLTPFGSCEGSQHEGRLKKTNTEHSRYVCRPLARLRSVHFTALLVKPIRAQSEKQNSINRHARAASVQKARPAQQVLKLEHVAPLPRNDFFFPHVSFTGRQGFYLDSVHPQSICTEFSKSNYGTFHGILMGHSAMQ